MKYLFIIAWLLTTQYGYAQGKIAFSSKLENNKYGIFIKHVDDTTETFITEGELPALSPDGKSLAYISPNKPNGTGSLTIINLKTGIKRILITDNACNPQWSPDNKYIICENWVTNTPSIEIVSIERGNIKTVIRGYKHPSYSPDGNKIVAIKNYDIYIITLASREVVRLTNTKDIIERLPVWSPDGREIAYFAKEKNAAKASICWIYLKDKQKHFFANFNADRFCWTYTGKILFEFTEKETDHSILIESPIGDQHPKILTTSIRDHYWPSWSKE
ncbi:MAG: PD40 domain-containing protein [Bacteroidetes bacterium]|nr:PD40 domain-containing protein [Bacteroidota bacterium]